MEYRLGLYEKAMPADIGFEAMLLALQDAGFDFLEISIDESDARQARLDWGKEARGELSRAIRASGVPVSTMCLSAHRRCPLGSKDPEIRRRGMELFRKAVEFAEIFGIRIIQLAGYDVYYETGNQETRKWFVENLADCVAFAASRGVCLGFETMETPFMDTVSKAMGYVTRVNSPYLGVYPDLGNLTNACRLYGTAVEDELESGRGHLLAMHIKETEKGKYRDMRFGTGAVDFAPGIQKALSLGVNLFVAECWYDGMEDWQAGLRDINGFVRGKVHAALGEDAASKR